MKTGTDAAAGRQGNTFAPGDAVTFFDEFGTPVGDTFVREDRQQGDSVLLEPTPFVFDDPTWWLRSRVQLL